MRQKMQAAAALLFLLTSLSSCDKERHVPACLAFSENEAFTARVGETWCLEGDDLRLTFGPILEDSRCNVNEVDCFWPGRFVLALTLEDGETAQDTFYAVDNWQDTLHYPGFDLFLDKVLPAVRPTTEWADTAAYRLEIRLVNR